MCWTAVPRVRQSILWRIFAPDYPFPNPQGGEAVHTILLVCGAGVSSTFLAQRLTQALARRELGCTVTPSSLHALTAGVIVPTAGTVLLLGPHLAVQRAELGNLFRHCRVAVLTEHTLRTLDGDAALDAALLAARDGSGDQFPEHTTEGTYSHG